MFVETEGLTPLPVLMQAAFKNCVVTLARASSTLGLAWLCICVRSCEACRDSCSFICPGASFCKASWAVLRRRCPAFSCSLYFSASLHAWVPAILYQAVRETPRRSKHGTGYSMKLTRIRMESSRASECTFRIPTPWDSEASCARCTVRMEEWWKALEDDCNRELRRLFQFEDLKMKKLLRKLLLRCL